MSNFYRAQVLITNVIFSVYDAYIEGISDILGKVHLIAKNAGSAKSKRKVYFKKGHLLEAVIFHKNRYYLSDTKVLEPFSAYCNNLLEVQFLDTVLQLIAGFVIYPDIQEFKLIITVLRDVLKDRVITISDGVGKLLEFLHLQDINMQLKNKKFTSIVQKDEYSLKLLTKLVNEMLK